MLRYGHGRLNPADSKFHFEILFIKMSGCLGNGAGRSIYRDAGLLEAATAGIQSIGIVEPSPREGCC